MLLDSENEFSAAQPVTSSGDTPSSKTIDMKKGGDPVGSEPYLAIQVSQSVASDNAPAVNFRLETGDASNFSDAVTLWKSGDFTKAQLPAGTYAARLRLPTGLKRYLRVVYNSSAALSAGKFNAFITNGIEVR